MVRFYAKMALINCFVLNILAKLHIYNNMQHVKCLMLHYVRNYNFITIHNIYVALNTRDK